jgi:hypothetical protein
LYAGLAQVSLFEEKTILPFVKGRAAFFTKPITNDIAQDTAYGNQDYNHHKIEKIIVPVIKPLSKFIAVDAGHKKQRISGKEEAGKQAGLCKDDKEQQK